MSEPLLDAEAIRHHLDEVADELAGSRSQRTIIVVGGALLALHGLRGATRDVDSATPIDPDLAAAVAIVGRRNDLAPTWLNDSAAAFLPADFDPAECEPILDRPALLVLGAPFDQVFLMKLFASRAADTPDLEALWSRCSFESPEAAAAAFHVAYPHVEHDEHLADHIRSII